MSIANAFESVETDYGFSFTEGDLRCVVPGCRAPVGFHNGARTNYVGERRKAYCCGLLAIEAGELATWVNRLEQEVIH